MFVAAFAHACLYGYKVMYLREALRDTVERWDKGIRMLREKMKPSWAQIMPRIMVSYPDHGSGYKK